MSATVRVLVCRVGLPPVVESLSPDREGGHLSSLQRIVGGTVTVVSLEDGLDLWCNDEALLLDLPLNRVIPAVAPQVPAGFEVVYMAEGLAAPGEPGEWRIHGDFLLTRCDGDGGLASVTDEDIGRYVKDWT